MAVENDEGLKRRMAGKNNGDMPPTTVDDVKVIMSDERIRRFFIDVKITAGKTRRVPDRRGTQSGDDEKDAFEIRISRDSCRGDIAFSFAFFRVDDLDFVFFSPGAKTSRESTGHAHEMIVVEVFRRSIQ